MENLLQQKELPSSNHDLSKPSNSIVSLFALNFFGGDVQLGMKHSAELMSLFTLLFGIQTALKCLSIYIEVCVDALLVLLELNRPSCGCAD